MKTCTTLLEISEIKSNNQILIIKFGHLIYDVNVTYIFFNVKTRSEEPFFFLHSGSTKITIVHENKKKKKMNDKLIILPRPLLSFLIIRRGSFSR